MFASGADVGSYKVRVGVLALAAGAVAFFLMGTQGLSIVGLCLGCYVMYTLCSTPSAPTSASTRVSARVTIFAVVVIPFHVFRAGDLVAFQMYVV